MTAPHTMLSARQFREGILMLRDLIFTQHPEPYRAFSKDAFVAEIDRLTDRRSDISEAEAFIEMSKLIGMLRDPHSWISIDDSSPVFSRAIPVRFWQFGDGLYVRAASPDCSSLVGARVLAINGVPIEEAWRRVHEAVGGGEQVATARAQVYLEIPEFLRVLDLAETDDRAALTLTLANGEQNESTLPAIQYSNYSAVWYSSHGLTTPEGWTEPEGTGKAEWLRRRTEAFWERYIPDSRTMFVQVNLATYDPEDPWNPQQDKFRPFVGEVFAKIADREVDRLVIDLRNNNGGFSELWQPLVHQIIRCERLVDPGRLFVFIGRLTESAAVAWATKIEMHSPAIFVGEPTATPPNFCNDPAGPRRRRFNIPGSAINFRVANVKEHWSHDMDWRSAIFPDIPVQMTWRHFAEGVDPAMSAILQLPQDAAAGFFVDKYGQPLGDRYSANYRRITQM